MWEKVKRALAFAMFAMMPVFFAWYLGPGLWADIELQRSGLVPAEHARVYSAWCKPSQIVFSKCEVRIEFEGREDSVEIEFIAMAGYLGKYQARALQSVTDPTRLTTTLNIEALASRGIAFALLFGGSLWLFGFLVWVNVRERLAASATSVPVSANVRAARTGSVVRASAFGRKPR